MSLKARVLPRARQLAQAVLPPRASVAAVAWSKWWLGEPEMRLLPWTCNQDRVAVDIGANAGVYTWHLRRLCRAVHAYEPISELAAALRRAMPGCAVHDYALSDEHGERTLRVPIIHGEAFAALASLANTFPSAEAVRSVQVRVAPLDDEGITDIGFIKIDAEGHEHAMLQGAIRTLTSQRPTLLIEIEERGSPGSIASTGEFLAALDYDGWYLARGALHPLREFQPLLMQDRDNMAEDGWARGPYINNFLFFPKTPSWQGQRRALDRFAAQGSTRRSGI